MVVQDRQGRPVTDLRAEEVAVFEDRVKCPLQSLRLVRAEPRATAGAPTTQNPVASEAAQAAPAEVSKAAGPGVAAGSESLRPSIVILVFDRMGVESAKAARQAAIAFARREFPPETWFAAYAIDDRAPIARRIIRESAALVPLIEQATVGADSSRDPGTTPEYATLTKQSLAEALTASGDATGVDAVDPVLAQNVRHANLIERMQSQAEARMDHLAESLNRSMVGGSALRALLAIASGLSGLEGRKTLLLFSEGLHVPAGLTDLLDTLVSEANRANLAVYAVDTRGLVVEGSSDESKLALLTARGSSEKGQKRRDPETRSRTELTTPELDQAVDRAEVHSHDIAEDALRMNPQGNLRDLSEATGGFLVANTNDIGSAVERIGADLRNYYEVGYYPANPVADGAFRAISVKLSRRGLSVRTRRGYLASSAGLSLLPYELTLAQAFDLAPSPHDFTHAVRTQLGVVTPQGMDVQLALEVPLRALRFDFDTDARHYRAHFSALVLVRDAQGRVVQRLSHDWPLQGALVDAPTVRSQSATVKRSLSLALGDYTVETAVADRLAGAFSLQRASLHVGAGSPTAVP